jgi:hypothetical protein
MPWNTSFGIASVHSASKLVFSTGGAIRSSRSIPGSVAASRAATPAPNEKPATQRRAVG